MKQQLRHGWRVSSDPSYWRSFFARLRSSEGPFLGRDFILMNAGGMWGGCSGLKGQDDGTKSLLGSSNPNPMVPLQAPPPVECHLVATAQEYAQLATLLQLLQCVQLRMITIVCT